LLYLQGFVLQATVGRILLEIWRNFDFVALWIDCHQFCVEESVTISPKEKARIRVVLPYFGVAIEMRSFKYLWWLHSRECTSLAKAVKHGKSESSLTSPPANSCF